MSLPDLERALLSARVSGFPVVEGGHLVGVVTRSDLVRTLSVEQSLGELLAEQSRDLGGAEVGAEPSLELVGRHLGRRVEELRVRDVMISSPIAVAPDAPLADVARTLVDRRIHRVLVVEDGRLLGIISSVDFVRLFADGRVGAA
jgi:CBS domain-containing protein